MPGHSRLDRRMGAQPVDEHPGGMTVDGLATTGSRRSACRRRAVARLCQARRHSRCVRFFKLRHPARRGPRRRRDGASTPISIPFRNIEGLTIGPVSVSGTHVTMESPRLTGFRNDSRPYEVTASARPAGRPQAELRRAQGSAAPASSRTTRAAPRDSRRLPAFSTPQKEQMDLRQDVRVRTDARAGSQASFRLHRLQGRHRGLERARHGVARQRRHRGRPGSR